MPDSKPSDERYTPEYILDVVREFAGGQIDCDPCTTPDNRTKAKCFYSREQNGLDRDWGSNGTTWVNPPYSRGQLSRWVARCIDQFMRLNVIALIPSDLGTQAGEGVAKTCNAICFVKGRIAFDSPQGLLKQGAKQPSLLVYWGRDARRFESVFSRLGVVWRSPPWTA